MNKSRPVSRRVALGVVAAVSLGAAAPFSRATAYPERPVRIVVPFAPGAGTDSIGRLIASKLGESLGASFVVENRTGASGAIGAQAVAQSPADGHTLLLAAAPFTTVPAALPSAGYDPLVHFAPVGMFATGPLVWAVGPQVPVTKLQDLIALAKQRPGVLNYGSAGVGGINHLVLELFKVRTGTFITHIPYRGIAPATLDAISGQIQLVTGTIPALAPLIRDGRLRALAVTSARRSPALPHVPSMAEAGLADFDVLNYFALMAPRGTPDTVVAQLNAGLERIVRLPDVQARLNADALEPATGSPEALARFLRQDFDGWKDVVRRQGLKIDAL